MSLMDIQREECEDYNNRERAKIGLAPRPAGHCMWMMQPVSEEQEAANVKRAKAIDKQNKGN